MKWTITLALPLTMLLPLLGCKSTTTQTAADNADPTAKAVLDLIAAGDADKMFQDYASADVKKDDEARWRDVTKICSARLGAVKTFKRTASDVLTRDDQVITTYGYQVEWEKAKGTFEMVTKIESGQPKIVQFRLNSDALADPYQGPDNLAHNVLGLMGARESGKIYDIYGSSQFKQQESRDKWIARVGVMSALLGTPKNMTPSGEPKIMRAGDPNSNTLVGQFTYNVDFTTGRAPFIMLAVTEEGQWKLLGFAFGQTTTAPASGPATSGPATGGLAPLPTPSAEAGSKPAPMAIPAPLEANAVP